MRRSVVIQILLVLILAACGAPGDLPATSTSVPATATAQPALNSAAAPTAVPASDIPIAKPTVPLPTAVSGLEGSGPRVLAWNANTQALAWYAATGQPLQLGQGASSRSLAIPCVLSPAGDQMVIHLGSDATAPEAIYPMGAGNIIPLGDNNGVACTIRGGIQFSPDSARLGLLRITDDALHATFTVGSLHILSLPQGTEQHAIDNVGAYTLYNDGALVLQFFANSKGEANAADLRWWDGTNERFVEQDVRPLDGCQFASGRIIRVGDKVYTLFGEKCTGKGSNWRLMRSDFAGGNSTNLAQGKTGGAYFVTAGANDMWPLPGDTELIIAYPNGLNLSVVNLARVNLSDGKVTDILNGAVVDQHPPAMPRRLLFNPAVTRLAAITQDGNGAETLYAYDLTRPDAEPVKLAGGNRSDRIGAIVWTADGSRLYYVSTGDTNAISYYTWEGAGERKLVTRGVFQWLVISPDGAVLASSKQNKVSDTDLRNNLVAITTADQQETILVEGGKGESALMPLAAR